MLAGNCYIDPLKVWYVDAYPGVGACIGYYGNVIVEYSLRKETYTTVTNLHVPYEEVGEICYIH